MHLDKSRNIHGEEARPFEARFTLTDHAATWQVTDLEADLVVQVVTRLRERVPQRKIACEFGVSVGKVNSIAKRARAAGKLL